MSWLIAAAVILGILAVYLPKPRGRRRWSDGGDGGHFWLWHSGSSHADHHDSDGSDSGGCDGGSFDGGGCDGGGGGD
jgi:hypothetical protein